MKNNTSKIQFIAIVVCLLFSGTTIFAQWSSGQKFVHNSTSFPQIQGNGAILELVEQQAGSSGARTGLQFAKNNGTNDATEAYIYYQRNTDVFYFGEPDNMGNAQDRFTIDMDNGNFTSTGTAQIDGNTTIGGILDIDNGNSNHRLLVEGDQAIWYDGTHFSWGFGGEYNFMADELKIGGDGAVTPTYRLEVHGDVGITGEINGVSDRRLKRNIAPIDNALGAVSRLKPVHYDFRTDEFPELNLPERHKMGFIAQEVEAVYPTVVTTGSEVSDLDGNTFDSKSISYLELIPVLTKAIQEQQIIIDELSGKLASLQAQVDQTQSGASASR